MPRLQEQRKGMYPALKQAQRSLKEKTEREQGQKQKETLITMKKNSCKMKICDWLSSN